MNGPITAIILKYNVWWSTWRHRPATPSQCDGLSVTKRLLRINWLGRHRCNMPNWYWYWPYKVGWVLAMTGQSHIKVSLNIIKINVFQFNSVEAGCISMRSAQWDLQTLNWWKKRALVLELYPELKNWHRERKSWISSSLKTIVTLPEL